MTTDEAVAFLRPAVVDHPGDWSDLGAGTGTFTAALAVLLGAPHAVTAADRDPAAIRALRRLTTELPRGAATLRIIAADLAEPTSLDGIPPYSQAGILFGNVLHYFADPLPLIEAAAARLTHDGVLAVVEYEGARANPWVPHPVSQATLRGLAEAAKLEPPDVVSETTSRYHNTLYCAVLRR